MNQSARKVFFNQDFFEVIDTEEKAYWLGFISADGSIQSTVKGYAPNRLSIAVSEKDKHHLESFMMAIHHTGELTTKNQPNSYADTPIYYLTCNSTKMCTDLQRHNISVKKTGHSHLPSLSQNLMHHFIRGYFDGDGCISVYKQKDKRKESYVDRLKQELSITSDFFILKEIQEILMKECNLPQTKIKEYKRTEKAGSLRYGGRQQIIRIHNYLYDNATVFLQRKKDKFALLLS